MRGDDALRRRGSLLTPSFSHSNKDKPYYTLGHGIIIMYLGMGWLASLIYYLGLRNANSRRARGLADETILSEQQDATPELTSQAAEARAKVAAQDTSFLGGFRALRRRYGECEGGTYATVNEAKEQKGDAYSGFGAWCGRE